MATRDGPQNRKWDRDVERVSHLTPATVTDLAYMFYVAGTEGNTPIHSIARDGVSDFQRLLKSVDSNSPAGQFLFIVQSTVVSVTRAIERKRNELHAQMHAADQQKDEMIDEISKGQWQSVVLKIGSRLLFLSAVGAFFFALTSAILSLPAISHMGVGNVDKSSGSTAPALGAIVVVSVLQSYYSKYRISGIINRYNKLIEKANRNYASQMKIEYQRAQATVRMAWKRHLRRNPPELPSIIKLIDALKEENTPEETLLDQCFAVLQQFREGRQKIAARWKKQPAKTDIIETVP